MSNLLPGSHIHVVGIGGSGLSAIARILLGQGYRVSGSDRSANDLTAALARDGATVYVGHAAAQVEGADALIITSAVKDDHVEVASARGRGIPVYKRQDIMTDLMTGKQVIAVAGTKGKTTTTAMIVHILREAGLDPSYLVGGVLGNSGSNAGVGSGPHFVVEADEYDHMFLGLNPNIAVITNIEWDHPDFFPTFAAMQTSFQQFVERLPNDGVLIGCVDDPGAMRISDARLAQGKPTHTYGILSPEPYDLWPLVRRRKTYTTSYWAHALVPNPDSTSFEFNRPGDFEQSVQIRLAGSHNVLNATAAMIAAHVCGVDDARSAAALSGFIAPARRFELRAEVNAVAVIDDYAHNPMSIRAVLRAARQRYPNRSIWAVWQPHTYSRTQALLAEYQTAFVDADHVLITDIYASREDPLPGVTSPGVIAGMRHPDVRHTPAFADAVEALVNGVRPPAVIVIMSAGDAPQIGINYLRQIQGVV